MDDCDDGRAGLGGAIMDEIVELPSGGDEGPAWTLPALVGDNLAIGDAVEIHLVQAMLRLHGEIAREMGAAVGCAVPGEAGQRLQVAAKLTRDLLATIKDLVAYRGDLLPKVKINPALVIGQMAKLQALLEPAAGTAQAALALRMEDLVCDWDRVIQSFRRQQEHIARALADDAYDVQRRATGLPGATTKQARAWHDLEIAALRHQTGVARDWSRIVRSDVRARVVYERPSAQTEVYRTEPQHGLKRSLGKEVH